MFSRREDCIAIALLLALVVAAFGNVVFGGKSLVASENRNPLDDRLRPGNYGPGHVPLEAWSRRNLVHFPNYRDPDAAWLQTDPAAEFLRRSLKRGEFPLWDPYVGGGTPSFASLVPAYLFPPSFLISLLGNGSILRNAWILLLIFTSAVLTYLLLRDRGLRREAAFAGAIAFAFSGAIIQTVALGLGQPVAFFSLALLVTARLVDQPSARRAAELAAAWAFIALASFPPVLMQVFGTCVLYSFVAVATRRAERRAAALCWFGAGALTGAAIAAVAYLPAFFVMAETPHIAEFYSSAAADTLPPHLLLQLLSPTIMGGAAIYATPAMPESPSGHLFYTGVVALFLAGIGALAPAASSARVLKLTVAIAGALSLAKVFGVPPVQWIAQVPLLRTVHYGAYFGILVAYAVATLAALGVDALLAGRVRRWHLAAGAAGLALALVFLRIFAVRHSVQLHLEGWRWIADFRLLVLFSILVVVLASLAFRWRGSVAALLVVTVLAAESITNSVYPRQRRWNIWERPPPWVHLLSRVGTGGRILPMPIYPANTHSVYRHSTLDSLTVFTSPRVAALYKRYFSSSVTHFLRGTNRIPPERVLDVANIEYVLLLPGDVANLAEAAARRYATLYRDDFVCIFRRPAAPRYAFVTEYRVAPPRDALEELSLLRSGTVVLEHPPSFPSAVSSAAVTPRVTRFSLNEVELTVDAPRSGMLVCSESNMRGWSATIDSRRVPIVPANYAFRAVEVPPGQHTIRFRYRPPGLIAGAIVTVAGILACAAGLLRRRRAAPAPEP